MPNGNRVHVYMIWSGRAARILASALKDNLFGHLLQDHAEAFLADQDITAGSKWEFALEQHIQASSVGVVCLTPENLQNSWMHYEAGAISLQGGRRLVIPVLLGVTRDEVSGPLEKFQCVEATAEGVFEIVKLVAMESIEGDAEAALWAAQRREVFQSYYWKRIEEALAGARELLQERPALSEETRNRKLLEDLVVEVQALSREVRRIAESSPGLSPGAAEPAGLETEDSDAPRMTDSKEEPQSAVEEPLQLYTFVFWPSKVPEKEVQASVQKVLREVQGSHKVDQEVLNVRQDRRGRWEVELRVRGTEEAAARLQAGLSHLYLVVHKQ